MMDIFRIARPEIIAMRAYSSARNSASADGILLNANEAPETHVADLEWQRLEINRYPAPQPQALRSRLAAMYGVDEESLLITRGSDEGIDLLTRVFCRAGEDAIVECSPCFGMYRIAATIQGAEVIDVPRQPAPGFAIDFDKLVDRVRGDDRVKIVFLTSPNNPTGDLVSGADLKRVLEACHDKALLVMDEAYIEFSDVPSAVELVESYPQLVVLRTLSKAWAAAGVRCGCVVASPDIISLLLRVIAPYPLSITAIDAALRAISEEARTRQQTFIEELARTKADFLKFLAACDWLSVVGDQQANFVLVNVEDADRLVDWCAEQGIRIRNFSSQPSLQGCVRLTIGGPQEMMAVKRALCAYGEQL
jgi:histidinol-phosphate aminotransferase